MAGPETSPSAYHIYQIGQVWQEPPGWQVAVTGVRCGDRVAGTRRHRRRARLRRQRHLHQRQRPAGTGTRDDAGPTWRISAYDGQGNEFHGRARPVQETAAGGHGSTDLVFEVPDGIPLRRVLIARGMIELP